jgi:hypothetical protein
MDITRGYERETIGKTLNLIIIKSYNLLLILRERERTCFEVELKFDKRNKFSWIYSQLIL